MPLRRNNLELSTVDTATLWRSRRELSSLSFCYQIHLSAICVVRVRCCVVTQYITTNIDTSPHSLFPI
jgi:hypothetical protein